jgi:ABC transporter DrrB family efflux protein
MIEDAASALRRAEIAVSDLGLRRPTLDDVFLQLTGAPPSENGAGVAPGDGQPKPPRASVPGAPAAPAPPVVRPAARRRARWRHVSLRETRADITDAGVVSVRNLRHFVRQPDLLVFSTIQPIMFVLLFTYVFGGAISHSLPAGVSYIDYLLPGILVQSVTFRASMTAIGLSDDLKLGVIDRFRSMPMARSAVLIGRTTADLVRNVLIIVLMIVVGYIIGFRFQAGALQALACIALVSAFGLALSWIFAFVAFTVRSAEAAQSAGFVILFPLVFASSVFVPVSSMPSWLQTFAKLSPVTLTANAARSFALVPGTPSSLGGAAAWIAGLLAVFIPLSVWRYRRMT